MRRPDSLRSWVVSGACCFINCLLYGVARLSGLLMVAAVDSFQVSRARAATPFSVSTSVRNLSGLFVGHLGQRFGVRVVVCSGCILASVGAGLCFFAQDVAWITLCWGGLFGAGYGLATCLLPLAINQHFVRHCGTASGISYSGAYIGSFIFPPLFVILLNRYGLPGTFLIISGAVLNVLAASMFFGTDEGATKAKGPVDRLRVLYDRNITSQHDRSHLSVVKKQVPPVYKRPLSAGKCKTKYRANLGKLKRILFVSYFEKKSQSTVDLPGMQVENIRLTSFKKLHGILCPCAHLSRPRNASQLNLNNNEVREKTDSDCAACGQETLPKAPPARSCRKLHRSLFSSPVLGVRFERKKSKIRKPRPKLPFPRETRSFLGDWLILFRKPMFLVISLTMSLYTFVIVCIITIIEDFAKDLHIPAGDVHYVLMVLSTADLVGTLTLGLVTDKGLLSRRHFISLCFLGMGACAASLSLCKGYCSLLSCVGCYGLFESGVVITFPLLVGEFVPPGSQAVAIASSNVFSAPTVLLVPIVIGHFRDYIGCYFGVFYLLGATSVACGLLWIMAPFFLCSDQKVSSKVMMEPQTDFS